MQYTFGANWRTKSRFYYRKLKGIWQISEFFYQRLDEACIESLDDINNKDRLLLVCTAMETSRARKGKMVVFCSTFVCPSYVTKVEFWVIKVELRFNSFSPSKTKWTNKIINQLFIPFHILWPKIWSRCLEFNFVLKLLSLFYLYYWMKN